MTFTYYRWRSRPGTWLGERNPEALICVWIAWPVQAGICWAPVNLNSIHLQRLSLAVCILVVVVQRHHHFWKLGRCSFYCQCHYVKSVWYLIYGEFEQHIPYQVELGSLHSFVLLSSAATIVESSATVWPISAVPLRESFDICLSYNLIVLFVSHVPKSPVSMGICGKSSV